jgi:hypothetical protein
LIEIPRAQHQNIGHGGETHAQLIGRHGGGRCPIGKQFELLADAVLGLAAGAVEVLVERARRVAAACQRGDDEARIGAS